MDGKPEGGRFGHGSALRLLAFLAFLITFGSALWAQAVHAPVAESYLGFLAWLILVGFALWSIGRVGRDLLMRLYRLARTAVMYVLSRYHP